MPYAFRAAMMSRRHLLAATAPAVLLAGCGGQGIGDLIGKVPVNITLPPEIMEAVEDVQAIVGKVSAIGDVAQAVTPAITKAKEIVAAVKAGAANASKLLSDAAGYLSPLVDMLKSKYIQVATAIATLLPSIAGSRQSARTGMSPMQARAVLRS